jgi:hypothetical protein
MDDSFAYDLIALEAMNDSSCVFTGVEASSVHCIFPLASSVAPSMAILLTISLSLSLSSLSLCV